MNQPRVSSGIGPRGGQFVATNHAESAVCLSRADSSASLNRNEIDVVAQRILATFRGDQYAGEIADGLRQLADDYQLEGVQ